jgi:hypothetical protein
VLYRQRVFGGVLPTALFLRKVAQMFRPPDAAVPRAKR